MSHRLERIVLVLVVCVPVPAFALSGLTLPLPGIVERAAAALVPWADAPTLDTHELAASTTRGSIVLDPDGATAGFDTETVAARLTRVTQRPRVTRPVVIAATGTTSVPRTDGGEPETPRDPSAPEHHSDEEASETPAPEPEEPAVEPQPAPSDEGGHEPAPKPDETPVDPAPEPEPEPKPTPRPHEEVDPLPPTHETDVPPADEPEITPVPDEKPVNEKPADSEPPPRNDHPHVTDTGA